MSELTNEELLKLLQQAKNSTKNKPTRSKGFIHRSVMNFINKFGIEKGDVRVPTYKIFYEYYVKWTSINKSNKIGRHAFFREFSKMFDPYRNGRQRFYMINDCFDMSKEALDKAYRHRNILKKNYIKNRRKDVEKES